ncbi:hypothetical protein JZK55_20440 [Dissulfurispira thermophila]|uniref:Uncharacterized protein n=2 Tax=root TaxID=1 RepID=A0A7G1H4P7_9BACT|nr:hypothetical protein [Dissulfurispira thermophila]BCB97122.1 hypothetical protein JZK55_20440 [Dissulfurispira thermophila]
MDKLDNKQVLMIISPVVITFFCVIILLHIKFKPSLSPLEQTLYGFSHQKLQVTKRLPVTITVLEMPIHMEDVPLKTGYPQVPLEKIAPVEKEMEIRVSLILINGGRKIAIINGNVLKEGDIFNQNIVAKIEKNRVLIKDKKGERWIRID